MSNTIKEVQQDTGNEPSVIYVKEHQMKVLVQTDLSGLTVKEQTLVQLVLIEEANVFLLDDTYISNITSTEMEIKLSDQAPVQFNYHSV